VGSAEDRSVLHTPRGLTPSSRHRGIGRIWPVPRFGFSRKDIMSTTLLHQAHGKRTLMRALVVVVLALVVVAVTGSGALADVTPPVVPVPQLSPLTETTQLMDYPLDIKGAELFASMPDAARSAWSAELGRVAASNASMYRAAVMYGSLDPETIAGVVPIHPSDPLVPPRLPATALSFFKVTPAGAGALAVAVTAFQERADIANGVTSWVGIDANNTVCSDPTASSGFINWLTGQDCTAFKQAAAYNADTGIQNVIGSTTACNSTNDCVQVVGTSSFASGSGAYGPPGTTSIVPTTCFSETTVTPQTGSGFAQLYVTYGGVEYNANAYPTNNRWWIFSACNGSPADTAHSYSASLAWPVFTAQVTPATITSIRMKNASGGAFGAASAVTNSGTDPAVTLVCTETFTSGSPASASTAVFHESSGAFPPPVCPSSSGKTVTDVQVAEVGSGVYRVLSDQPTTAQYQADQSQANTLCSGAACILDLMDLKTGKSCFSEADTCNGWLDDPTLSADYQCTYGGVAQDVNQCYVYAVTFDTAKRQAGDAYADPHTGQDVGDQGPTSWSADTGLSNEAVTPPSATRSCFGGSWSDFNPLQWVLQPIQCALQWAFVPDPAVAAMAGASMTTAWSGTEFGQISPLLGQFSSIPVSTGCSGLPIDISETWPVVWGIHWNFGAACSGPLSSWAALVNGLLGALILAAAVIPVVRYVAAAGGFVGFAVGRA
jgi:hypothetical protein